MCIFLDPSLTIIIPTFNRVDVLGRAVDSVLGQSVADIELIVVDDGSTDGTAELLAGYDDPRLRTVVQANAGVCAARNAGVMASAGGFLAFLDSDDEAAPGWLTFFHDAAVDGVQFASCGVRILGDEEEILAPKESGAEFGFIRARFLAGAFGIEKNLLAEIGGFRSGLEYSEHTDLALRLGGRMIDTPFTCRQTDRPLLTTHPSPRSYDPLLRYESAKTILTADAEHLARSPHLHATYAAVAGVAAAKIGLRRESRRLLVEAIRANPLAARNYVRLARVIVRR